MRNHSRTASNLSALTLAQTEKEGPMHKQRKLMALTLLSTRSRLDRHLPTKSKSTLMSAHTQWSSSDCSSITSTSKETPRVFLRSRNSVSTSSTSSSPLCSTSKMRSVRGILRAASQPLSSCRSLTRTQGQSQSVRGKWESSWGIWLLKFATSFLPLSFRPRRRKRERKKRVRRDPKEKTRRESWRVSCKASLSCWVWG